MQILEPRHWFLTLLARRRVTWLTWKWTREAQSFIYGTKENSLEYPGCPKLRSPVIFGPRCAVNAVPHPWWMRLLAGQWQEGQLQCYRTAPSAARLTWEGPAHEGLHQSRLGQAGARAAPILQNSVRSCGPPVGSGRKTVWVSHG